MTYAGYNFKLFTSTLLVGLCALPVSAQVKTGLQINDGGDTKAALRYDLGSSHLLIENTEASGPFEFVSDSTRRFVIDSSGQVGVGNLSPTAPLHLQAGPLRLGASAEPASPQVGDMIIDSDDGNSLKWYNGSSWQAAGGVSTPPGGATYDVQFSNAGSFAGTEDFIWDDSTKSLIIGNPDWPWGNIHLHHPDEAYLVITTDDNLIGGYFGVDEFSFYMYQGENKALAFGTDDQERMRIQPNGFVGIGLDDPTHILHIAGQGRSTQSSWATTSDARLKTVTGTYTPGLLEITALNPIRFRYKENNPYKLPSDQEFSGVLAQDLQQVIPEAVTEGEDGYLSVNMDPVHWALVNAVKELHEENLRTKKLMAEQQETLDELKNWACMQERTSNKPPSFCRN